MDNHLFQTGLYFFSSLLQADAAILGFGTIFIIFKLQSLNSLKQNIIQAYYTKGPDHIGIINKLLFLKNSKKIAHILSNATESDRENYKHILCIPKRAEQVSKSIKLPIIIIGSHASLSAIFLLINDVLYRIIFLYIGILIICIIWFVTGIFLAGKLAIKTLTKTEEFKLEELLPEVYEELNHTLHQ